MAKRKKKSKGTSRRRSVGALALNPASPLVQIGSVAVGFLMADTINGAIDKVTGDKIDSKIVAGGQVGLGALLVLKKGGKKSLPLTVAGGVLAGAGLKRGLSAFGLGQIGGYQAVPAVGGYQAVPALNGSKKVAGYIPGHGGMSLNGTKIPMRSGIAGGSGVRDR